MTGMELTDPSNGIEAGSALGLGAGDDCTDPVQAGEDPLLSGPSRILIVDDSRLTRRYLKGALQRGGCESVELAESAANALSLLGESDFDLILCDLNMPKVSGLDFLGLMRREPALERVPVIMLTSEEGLESKLECLESGASDYLVKPFAEEELVARARIHLKIKALQDELQAKNERLRDLACLDFLTGVSNRYDFLRRLEIELSRASREQLPISLAMIDLDHFKAVNDTHGHLVGDRTLVRVAELLTESIRDYDLLARYGGEEFCAVLVNTDETLALKIAERCRRHVSSNPVAANGLRVPVTVSIGVATTTGPDPVTATELISHADEALYLAKNRGRNQVLLAPPLVAVKRVDRRPKASRRRSKPAD